MKYKLVPVEPTKEMLDIGNEHFDTERMQAGAWIDMVAAAPNLFTPNGQSQLDYLQAKGFVVSGLALQKMDERAYVDKQGLVLWPMLENAPEDQASEETLEQCRIIGMSAECEAKHLAEIDRLQLAVSKNADCIREQANLLGLGVERELRLRGQVEQQNRLIEQCKEALLLAQDTFQRYAAHHAAKPDLVKAGANQALADQMAEVISDIMDVTQ